VKTEDLVSRLADDTASAAPPSMTLARGLIPGAIVSLAAMIFWLGLRPDFADATATAMFWMKLGYALAFALITVPIVLHLSRPTGTLTRFSWLLIAPFAVIVAMAIYRLSTAPPGTMMHLVMGRSSSVCPWRIVALSLPILVGIIVSLRGLAPTHLVSAGAAAGILAGAVGTFIYALHCTESAAPFVAVWYTLGILAMATAGALLGRVALRW
jgi:hypothetical protein